MPRADVHAAIRGRSTEAAADLDQLIALLDGHKTTLDQVLALEATAVKQGADNVTRHNLNALGNRARRFLRRIEGTLNLPVLGSAHDDLGEWGENGWAPAIRDLARSAEFHASYITTKAKAA